MQSINVLKATINQQNVKMESLFKSAMSLKNAHLSIIQITTKRDEFNKINKKHANTLNVAL